MRGIEPFRHFTSAGLPLRIDLNRFSKAKVVVQGVIKNAATMQKLMGVGEEETLSRPHCDDLFGKAFNAVVLEGRTLSRRTWREAFISEGKDVWSVEAAKRSTQRLM